MEPEKRARPAIRTAMQMSGGFGEVLAKRGQGKEQGLPFAALTVLIKGEKELAAKRRKSRNDWVKRKEALKADFYPRWEEDQCMVEDTTPKLAFSATAARQLPALKCVRSEASSPVLTPSGKGKVVLFKPRKMNRGKTGVGLPVLPSSPRAAPFTSRFDPKLPASPVRSSASQASLLSLKLLAKTPVPPPVEAVLQPVVRLLQIDSSEFDSSGSCETPTKQFPLHFRNRSEW